MQMRYESTNTFCHSYQNNKITPVKRMKRKRFHNTKPPLKETWKRNPMFLNMLTLVTLTGKPLLSVLSFV